MRAKHSARGEDGVSYAACKANSSLSVKVLHNCFSDLASSYPLTDLIAFNKQIVWFAPKGASEDDRVAVMPIFGRKCVSEIDSGIIFENLANPTLKVTPQNQMGFGKGRS